MSAKSRDLQQSCNVRRALVNYTTRREGGSVDCVVGGGGGWQGCSSDGSGGGEW